MKSNSEMNFYLNSWIDEPVFNTPTVFLNVPIFSIVIDTISPAASVKSLPGTKPVPVMRKHPLGNFNPLNNQPANSGRLRFILLS